MFQDLKNEYNYNLERYYNGIKYCENHPSEIERWTPELLKIKENLERLIKEISKNQKISEKEIIEGFN